MAEFVERFERPRLPAVITGLCEPWAPPPTGTRPACCAASRSTGSRWARQLGHFENPLKA